MWMSLNNVIKHTHTHTCTCTVTVSKYKTLCNRLTAPNLLDEVQKNIVESIICMFRQLLLIDLPTAAGPQEPLPHSTKRSHADAHLSALNTT